MIEIRRVLVVLFILVVAGSVTTPVMAIDTLQKDEKIGNNDDFDIYEVKINGSVKKIAFHKSLKPKERQAIILKLKLFESYRGCRDYTNLFKDMDAKDIALLIEAVNRASTLSTQEKNEIKKMITQIDTGKLSAEDQSKLVLKLLVALQDYTMQFKGVSLKDLIEKTQTIEKDGKVSTKWVPGDHITLTKYALQSLKNVWGFSISDSRINTISSAADDPDYNSITHWDHYGDSAVNRVEEYSNDAKKYYSSGDISKGDYWTGYASHFLCDLGNPWHAVGLLQQDIFTHDYYEQWVHSNLGTWAEELSLDSLHWYVYSTPRVLAEDLKNIAASKYDDLEWMILHGGLEYYGDEMTAITCYLLEETVAYNMGLIDYSLICVLRFF